MASAFNVASGFAGYMPFGYVAFYGIGAFTTAILVKKAAFPLFLALPLSGVAGIVLALLFAPTLRLVRHLLRHRQPGAGRHLPPGDHQHARGDHRRQLRPAARQPRPSGAELLRHDGRDGGGAGHHPVAVALAARQGAARHPRRCRRRRDDGRQRADRAPLRLADRGVLPGGLRRRRSLVHQRRRHRDRLQHPDHRQDGDLRRRRRARHRHRPDPRRRGHGLARRADLAAVPAAQPADPGRSPRSCWCCSCRAASSAPCCASKPQWRRYMP